MAGDTTLSVTQHTVHISRRVNKQQPPLPATVVGVRELNGHLADQCPVVGLLLLVLDDVRRRRHLRLVLEKQSVGRTARL